MLENANERGIQLMTGLRKLQEEYPQIGDVRGKGLMIGLLELSGEEETDPIKPVGWSRRLSTLWKIRIFSVADLWNLR